MEQHYLHGNGQVHQDKSLLFLQLWSPLELPTKKKMSFSFSTLQRFYKINKNAITLKAPDPS